MVAMQVPSAVATRSVGEKRFALAVVVDRGVGGERATGRAVHRLAPKLALVGRVDPDHGASIPSSFGGAAREQASSRREQPTPRRASCERLLLPRTLRAWLERGRSPSRKGAGRDHRAGRPRAGPGPVPPWAGALPESPEVLPARPGAEIDGSWSRSSSSPRPFRAWSILALRSDLRVQEPIIDGRYYLDLANRLAHGGGWPTGPIFMTPLYPLLLSFIFRLGGSGVAAAQLFQSLLGLGTLWFLWVAVRRDLGPRAATGTAVLYTFCGPILAMESLVLTESLLLFLVSVGLWAWPGRNRMRGASAVFGVACGLLAIGRGVFLLLPMAWAVLARVARPPVIRGAILVFAGVLAALLPLSIHQSRALGRVQVLTLNGGLNLYLGNNPAARGLYSLPAGVDLERDLTGVRSASVLAGRPLTPVEADRFYAGRAAAFLRERPGRALWLLGRKALLFLAPREIPQIENFDALRASTRPLRAAFVDFRWILPLAALGVASAWSRRGAPPGRAGGPRRLYHRVVGAGRGHRLAQHDPLLCHRPVPGALSCRVPRAGGPGCVGPGAGRAGPVEPGERAESGSGAERELGAGPGEAFGTADSASSPAGPGRDRAAAPAARLSEGRGPGVRRHATRRARGATRSRGGGAALPPRSRAGSIRRPGRRGMAPAPPWPSWVDSRKRPRRTAGPCNSCRARPSRTTTSAPSTDDRAMTPRRCPSSARRRGSTRSSRPITRISGWRWRERGTGPRPSGSSGAPWRSTLRIPRRDARWKHQEPGAEADGDLPGSCVRTSAQLMPWLRLYSAQLFFRSRNDSKSGQSRNGLVRSSSPTVDEGRTP